MADPRETIEKLLQLAQSSNVNEAAAAAAKAQELMSKYHLDAATFNHAHGVAAEAIDEQELHDFGVEERAAYEVWIDVIAICLAEENGCKVYTAVYGTGDEKTANRVLQVLGTKDQIATVRYMLAALMNQGRTLAKWECIGQSRKYRQSFLLGYASKIRSRLQEAGRAARARAARDPSRAGALVRLVDTEARILEALKKHELQDVDATYTYSERTESAFQRGRSIADGVPLEAAGTLSGTINQLPKETV